MIQGIEIIFQDKEQMVKGLKKWIYEKNTETFIEQYKQYFIEMSDFMLQAEKKEDAADEIAKEFTKAVKNAYSGWRGKVKPIVQMDLNMFMIYYVFPTILDRVEYGKILADRLCKAWNETFTISKIEYADYNTLYDSINDKILGIL